MKIIGLTGGIASGKSTVSQTLKQLGAVLIDADEVYHKTIEPHQPAWEDIVRTFGEDVLHPDGMINRDKLAGIVFTQEDCLRALNEITHPRVGERFTEELKKIQISQPDAVVVIDVPLLYETHMDRLCDEVWVIWVDRETQIQRLMNRNGYNRDEAIRRIEAQMSLDEKAKLADAVIDNRCSIEETIRTVTKYYKDILQKS